jgi:hypothetical protein
MKEAITESTQDLADILIRDSGIDAGYKHGTEARHARRRA